MRKSRHREISAFSVYERYQASRCLILSNSCRRQLTIIWLQSTLILLNPIYNRCILNNFKGKFDLVRANLNSDYCIVSNSAWLNSKWNFKQDAWKEEFDAEMTKKNNFFKRDGSKISCDFMKEHRSDAEVGMADKFILTIRMSDQCTFRLRKFRSVVLIQQFSSIWITLNK